MISDNNLPHGWVTTFLGEIAEWGSGGTPSRRVKEYFEGDIPWIKTGELNQKYISDSEEKISRQAVEKSSAKIFPRGSVGIAMYGATIGKLAIWKIDASTNQACAVAKIDINLLFNEFLYYFLVSEKSSLIKAGKGGAQPNISQGIIKSWEINLPSLSEQHRIVAKIEELFSEIDKGVESLKTAKSQLQVYRQALLKHAFEGKLTAQWRSNNPDKVVPAEELLRSIEQAREERYQQKLTDWQTAVEKWEFNGKEGKSPSKPRKNKLEDKIDSSPYFLPPGWLWLQLGNSNVHISDGPFGSNLKTEDYVEEGIRLIRLENIGRGFFIGEKKTHITLAKYEYLKKHSLQPSDLVLSSFITDLIRVAEIPSDLKISINKSDCFQIRLFGNTIDVKYLLYGLQINSVYKQLEKFVHGVGRPRINTTQLKNVQIPVCSPEEQQELVKLLNAAMSYINATEKSIEADLNKSDILRQSILKKAFSGQLVPQDPTDEPASELLKRIQTEKAQRETTTKTKLKSTNLPRQLTVLRDI